MNVRPRRFRRPAPAPLAPATRNSAPRQVVDTRHSLLVAALVWIMIGYLELRWDWLFTDSYGAGLVEGEAYAVNSLTRFIKIALLVVASIVILTRLSIASLTLRHLNKMFIAFYVLVLLSALWSISPADTLVRFVGVTSAVAVCWALAAAGWHPKRFQDVLRPFFTITIVASLVVGLMYPSWVAEHGAGALKDAWHGIFSSKNAFGEVTAIGVIIWVHYFLFESERRWRALPPLAIAFTCLLLSRSSTSMLAALFASCLMVILYQLPHYSRRQIRYIVSFFAIITLVYGLAVLQLFPGLDLLFKPIAALTGKDTTFSNRAMIWQIIEQHIALHPLLGTGYGAYWIGPVPTSPSFVFLALMYFYPFESHNGYLEIVNDLGYVGLFCLSGFLIIYLRQCIQLFKYDRNLSVLLLGLFFQQALINLSESTWLNVSTPLPFIVMTFATFSLARAQSMATPESMPAPHVASIARRPNR